MPSMCALGSEPFKVFGVDAPGVTAAMVEHRRHGLAVPEREGHTMRQRRAVGGLEAAVPGTRIGGTRPPVARRIAIQINAGVKQHRHRSGWPALIALGGAVEPLAVNPAAVRPARDRPATDHAAFGRRWPPNGLEVAVGGTVLGYGSGERLAAAGARQVDLTRVRRRRGILVSHLDPPIGVPRPRTCQASRGHCLPAWYRYQVVRE